MEEVTKQCGKHTFHKANCHNKIRKVHQNYFGDTITLLGRHNFEYSVAVQKGTCFLAITTFPTRQQAISFFNLKVKEYKQ